STLILDEDANIVSAGFNARDMDYANGVTVSAREIAIAFQVPPELIGDSANKTYSNAQEANREFAQHTVVPLADQMYEALSRRLWPTGDAKLTYDRSAIDALKGDESALLTALTACDFLTTNEKRARMNYGEVDGGDEILTGMGKVPLSETSTPIDQLLGGERC
ncbi:MAG: phage portal protein, partial [Candidatus Methanomethylophilaceae archaeon]|nr:phage portal protein [Candidatus Methanomethylophilaceae archaeon]